MEHKLGTGDKAIVGNFTLSAQMPNGRTINVAGYVYEGETSADLDARLDMMQGSIERQRKMREIPEIEAKLEQLNAALTQQNEAYQLLLEKKQSGKVSSQEATHLDAYPINMKRMIEEISKGKKELAEAQALFK